MSLQESGYEALARKYRPQTFDDVVGQEHVIAALKNSFENNRIHHAYLLTGTRGIGKTTIARIIAKCLECEGGITVNPHTQDDENCCSICNAIANGNFPDVIEIDAASQTDEEFFGRDEIKIEQGKEQAIEQYPGNHGDGRGNGDDDIGGMEPVDSL